MNAYLKLPFFKNTEDPGMFLVIKTPGSIKLIDDTPSSWVGVNIDNLVYIKLCEIVNYPILKRPRLRKIIRSLKNKNNNLCYITLSNDPLGHILLNPIEISKEEIELLIDALKCDAEIYKEQEFNKSCWLEKFIKYLEQQV